MFEMNFQGPSTPFSTSYQCYPMSFYTGNYREEIDNGGNIFLPPSALEHLSRLNVQYPMLFMLTNKKANRTTHCGVLEFVADEGRMYMPYWMLRNLLLEEGDVVHVKSVALNVANFAKFQPQDVSFLDISNPKAVLEKALRGVACLTVGDIIAIKYNERTYELKVLETKPSNAVTIIECDMRVDFAPPVGYVEKKYRRKSTNEEVRDENESLIPVKAQGLKVFGGMGHRLDGRVRDSSTSAAVFSAPGELIAERGIPNFEYQPGSLTFLRVTTKGSNEEAADTFKAFEGQGVKLKPGTKNCCKPDL